jgi:uncharacterized membrane protein YecN with MAPEG domain
MILPITMTIAGAAALLNAWLAIRCSLLRRDAAISVGDGGDARMTARMRAHANFIEYTPIILILIGLVELAEGPSAWLWVVGVVYILARIAHALGMDGPMRLRVFGAVTTFVILIGLGIYAAVIPFISTGKVIETVQTGAAPAAWLPHVSLQ